MAGRRIVVSGLGSVGGILARTLAGSGAEVIVSDVDTRKRQMAAELNLSWVEPEKALSTPADIVVPAAVGGVLSPDTVARLDCALVVGGRQQPAHRRRGGGPARRSRHCLAAGFRGQRGRRDLHAVLRNGRPGPCRCRDQGGGGIGETVARLLASSHVNVNRTTPLREAVALAERRLG
ncbi:Rossmann-fold NAD(P)-binding domain-containing protein [Fodinicola feengrottensis]|uniref:hypothetical protein n=1 Tax=Fodinicola feengrottensis TaxID=435914 RepID=UPI0036F2A1D7